VNKQSWAVDKGWSSSLGVGRGANNYSPYTGLGRIICGWGMQHEWERWEISLSLSLASQPSLGLGLLFFSRLLNNFLFYRVGLLAPSPTPNLKDQTSVFISPRGRVAQFYPQAPVTHFSRLLRHAWVTVGLFLRIVGKPEGTRQRRRLRRTWEDIRMDLREREWKDADWMQRDKGRDQWQALVAFRLHKRREIS
jgi:hypothetical protein